MLNSFLVAFRVVLPMALLMAAGALVRHKKIIDRPTMRQVDKLIFRLFMPLLMFKNVYEVNLAGNIDWAELAMAAAGMLAVFAIAVCVPPRLEKDPGKAAAIGQAVVRPNYILFGVAVGESIYGRGNAGAIALLSAIVVPAANALSVVILEMNRTGKTQPLKIILSVLKNPMIVAAFLALACRLLPFSIPDPLFSVIRDIADATTTISFLSLGVSLDFGELKSNRRPLITGVVLRMGVIPLIFLPVCVLLGFRGITLCALMILFAAPAAVASYPMAVAMGADGPLAGQLVCTTTLVSILTIFCYTFLFQALGYL